LEIDVRRRRIARDDGHALYHLHVSRRTTTRTDDSTSTADQTTDGFT
jgi:hypothetical protein